MEGHTRIVADKKLYGLTKYLAIEGRENVNGVDRDYYKYTVPNELVEEAIRRGGRIDRYEPPK
jgi:hypothetical protein